MTANADTTPAEPSRADRWRYSIFSKGPHWVLQCVNWGIARVTDDRPFHGRDKYEWAAAVEELYPEVRREMEGVLNHIQALPTIHEMFPNLKYYYSHRDWRHLAFYVYGQKFEDHCTLYPKTWEAFQRVPGLIAASASILSPHEDVPLHTHSYKGIMIFHLGVIVPHEDGGCGMRIGDVEFTWDEGKIVAIDPTFAHETWNRTDRYRIILLGEFHRPDMPRALKFLDDVFIWAFRWSPIGRKMISRIRQVAVTHRQAVEAARQMAAAR